jgi:hypothetical protein
MKKLSPVLAASTLFAASALFAAWMTFSGGPSFTAQAAQKDATFRGEIMDSDCAKMGSHPESDAKKCTVDCVKDGSKYVLFNAAEKSVRQLDDQKKPAAFAGQKVVVSGTLDKATNTIHVAAIKAG